MIKSQNSIFRLYYFWCLKCNFVNAKAKSKFEYITLYFFKNQLFTILFKFMQVEWQKFNF